MKRTLVALGLVLLLVGALGGAGYWAYTAGRDAGKAACEAVQSKSDVVVLQEQKVTTQKTVNRSAKVGATQERQRTAITTTFTAIEKEQAHAPADPVVDSCVLPAERLRLWAAANAGTAPGAGASTGQHHGAATAAATPGIGSDAGPGGQPHGGGQGLPPAGTADVQPAGVPGDQP